VVNGDPRSLVNTKADLSARSRCSRRRARSSSPRIGCVLGVPFLIRRTARVAALKIALIPTQVHQLTRPQTMPVADQDHGLSRWPQRLPLTTFCSRSTSPSVRYSRVRSWAFLRRRGVTVRFLAVGDTSFRCAVDAILQFSGAVLGRAVPR
jgi:hypothetical protein